MRAGAVSVVTLALIVTALGGCEKSDSDTAYSVLDEDASVYLKDQNTVQFHLTASSQDPDACIGCHGDKKSETNNIGGETYHSYHAQVTISYTCVQCHTSVDLLEGSGGNLRKQVASSVCRECHGSSGPGPELYQTE